MLFTRYGKRFPIIFYQICYIWKTLIKIIGSIMKDQLMNTQKLWKLKSDSV